MKNRRAKPELPTGRISFRTKPEFHAELIKVAQALGIDTSALINQVLAERLPDHSQRAALLEERREAARQAWQALRTQPTEEEVAGTYAWLLSNTGLSPEQIAKRMETDVATVKRRIKRHREWLGELAGNPNQKPDQEG